MSTAIIGVGSNLGSREASIHAASFFLHAQSNIQVSACSGIYETPPLGPKQPDYLNSAFRIETCLAPHTLLEVMLDIEHRLGRVRHPNMRWGPRSLDLDLLWMSGERVQDKTLVVPHPKLTQRAFALTPLLALMPELTDCYGQALQLLGGPLKPWEGRATIQIDVNDESTRTHVEASSMMDACALALREPKPCGHPRNTFHRTLSPNANALLKVVHDLARDGFCVHFASISHCSATRWQAHFHGAHTKNRMDSRIWIEEVGTIEGSRYIDICHRHAPSLKAGLDSVPRKRCNVASGNCSEPQGRGAKVS